MSTELPISPVAAGWRLENTYAELPQGFFTAVEPTPVKEPRLVVFNAKVAELLGLERSALEGSEGAAIFSGNALPPGSVPIAQAYSGHQYGYFTTLGDGRAILLGEQLLPDGARFDVQLKGAGPTPYSRRGDGRAALGPMLREYIISEAMAALGIPTTRALAVALTGENVYRETVLKGAVLTRIAASHIRVGTFEGAASRRDEVALQALVDYTLKRHFPETADRENKAEALLEGVIERQARLIAQWMHVGFVHGVMNTDNMALSGETIDYGPCAFIDAYDPATVFSSIDQHGRYAFGNQPSIAQWNLARLAEALLPLLHTEEKVAVEKATALLNGFGEQFHAHLLNGFRRKLGLFNSEPGDTELLEGLLSWMQKTKADFTNSFAALSYPQGGVCALPGSSPEDAELAGWQRRWEERLKRQEQSPGQVQAMMQSTNPAVIPRNHLVEDALSAAELGDFSRMERLMQVLTQPFAHGVHPAEYLSPAQGGTAYRTFCGT